VVIAGKRDRHDAEAGGVGDTIAHIVEGVDNGRDVIALDRAVGDARNNHESGAGNAEAARQARLQQPPTIHDLC